MSIIVNLKNLCLIMGHIIRAFDDAGDHAEVWTNDGEYVPHPAFNDPRLGLLEKLEPYVTADDVDLPTPQLIAIVADRIQDDLRDGTYNGGPNSNNPKEQP